MELDRRWEAHCWTPPARIRTSPIRASAPTLGVDGEALIGPGMKDARSGKPVVGQFRHPIPREAVLLGAAPERSTPEVGHIMPERRERPAICGYRIVSEMACHSLGWHRSPRPSWS